MFLALLADIIAILVVVGITTLINSCTRKCAICVLLFCRCYCQNGWCCCNVFDWQMLLPCGWCYCHYFLLFSLFWQLLLPPFVVLFGRCCCLEADGIAYHGCRWQMQYFNFNSDDLCRTSSHMWGRWYLPIFLFRDGSLTLMNRVSLIALVRFWSSLPIILKLLMVTLWPDMLQWSWMGEWDLCSLNLSAKVLADSPMYSSSLHLYLYMTPLLLVIGSLSLGTMSRSFMVWPPLKCTCTPYFWQVFLILSLSPCWYGTTICIFLLLVVFSPVWLLFLLLLLDGFWLFILALMMVQMGYLHFWRAWHRLQREAFAVLSSKCRATNLPDKCKAILHSINATAWSSCKAIWALHREPDQDPLTDNVKPEPWK